MSTIAENIAAVRSRINKATLASNRLPDSVLLLAVSKTKSDALIREAHAAGLTHFGENYAQEALDKIARLHDLPITWHYIGSIQANKTKALAEHFTWVHAVDRLKIAQRLNEQRPVNLPALNICLEVNVDNEPSKAGVSLADLPALAAAVSGLPRLRLHGLMAIPKATSSPQEQRSAFERLTSAFNHLKQEIPTLDTLSMGMSGDMEAAIAAGSTIVRIGTDIFGARDYSHPQSH